MDHGRISESKWESTQSGIRSTRWLCCLLVMTSPSCCGVRIVLELGIVQIENLVESFDDIFRSLLTGVVVEMLLLRGLHDVAVEASSAISDVDQEPKMNVALVSNANVGLMMI